MDAAVFIVAATIVLVGALAVLGFLRLCMPKPGEFMDEVS